MVTTFGATNDDKVGIIAPLDDTVGTMAALGFRGTLLDIL